MKIKEVIILFSLTVVGAPIIAESWDSIGSSITGAGGSIWNGMKAMGEGMIGASPSGYYYDFQVFNGSNIPVQVTVNKAKNIMGARFNVGSGDSATVQPGQDSGNTFYDENLYFSISIEGAGLDYTDDHYTLGQQHDTSVYFYHTYNDKDTGSACAELVGGGYTTGQSFTGRIENKTANPVAVTFTITNTTNLNASGEPDVRTMTVSDIDPGSFTYLTPPAGYSMRPSVLGFSTDSTTASVLVSKNGMDQITSKSGVTPITSTPVSYNYIVNGALTPCAYETGVGPGAFDQPQNGAQLRDISPVECQMYYQGAGDTEPIGSLLPVDIAWESVWYVYTGYGWSQEEGQIIQYPMGQIPLGQCASFYLIRPSIASEAANGPARLLFFRLSIPEASNRFTVDLAKRFLTNVITAKIQIYGLSNSPQGGSILRNNATAIQLQKNIPFLSGGVTYLQSVLFNPADAFVAYPPLSETVFGSSVTLNALTPDQKSQILGMELPEKVGLLYDPATTINGYCMATDVFYPYGMGGGPFYYQIGPPYFDLSQMLSALISYAGMCNYAALTSDSLTQIQTVLAQTLIEWVAKYFGNPTQVIQSLATFLVLLGKGSIAELLQNFGGSGSSLYTMPNVDATTLLSPQGMAFLKMLLYGPCSISQVPTYYKAGSSSLQGIPGWPAVTVSL